jgi:uncharacterized protein (TIGR02646 family)
MRKFQRGEEPDFLAENWEDWGLRWEQRKASNLSASFGWPAHQGEAVNHKLLPHLKRQTQDHCSFCDAFPVSPPSLDTIEHFRPKGKFPKEAYHWTNLYFCCNHCQQKGEEFDNALLQPDAPDYEFDRYFRWDFTRGTIEVNESALETDQNRADVTRKLYRLNEKHPGLRKFWAHRRIKLKDEDLDTFPYRDYIEGPVPGSQTP